jgi:Na+-driven multidrug efflux pump
VLKSPSPFIEIQFLVLKTNEHQLKEMKLLARKLKADKLTFKSAQLYDFENGKITENILQAALPMLVAQLLSLLYNIIDRIYIARIPHIGTTALGAVGLCFPIIVIITAFSNLFGSGGAPLFSIRRGENNSRKASEIMNTSYTMVCGGAIVLMVIGFLFARPILRLFGASESALVYAYPYLMIYLLGTLPSMISTSVGFYKCSVYLFQFIFVSKHIVFVTRFS